MTAPEIEITMSLWLTVGAAMMILTAGWRRDAAPVAARGLSPWAPFGSLAASGRVLMAAAREPWVGKGNAVPDRRHLQVGTDIDAHPKRAELVVQALIRIMRPHAPGLDASEIDELARQAFAARKRRPGPEARNRQQRRRQARLDRRRKRVRADEVVMAATMRRTPEWMRVTAEIRAYKGGRRSSKRLAAGIFDSMCLLPGVPVIQATYDALHRHALALAWALGLPAWPGWLVLERTGDATTYEGARQALLGNFIRGEKLPETGYRPVLDRRKGQLDRLPEDLFNRLLVASAKRYARQLGLDDVGGLFAVDGVKVALRQLQRQSISMEEELLLSFLFDSTQPWSAFGRHRGSPGWRGGKLLLLTWMPHDPWVPEPAMSKAEPMIIGFAWAPANRPEFESLLPLIRQVQRLWLEEDPEGPPLVIDVLLGDSAFDVKAVCLDLEYLGTHPMFDWREPAHDDDPANDAGSKGYPTCPNPECPRHGRWMRYIRAEVYPVRRRLGLIDRRDRRKQPLSINVDRLDWPDDVDEVTVLLAEGPIVLRRDELGRKDGTVTLLPGQSVGELVDLGLLRAPRIHHQCQDETLENGSTLVGCRTRAERKLADDGRRHLFFPGHDIHRSPQDDRWKARKMLYPYRNDAEARNAVLERLGFPLVGEAKPSWIKTRMQLIALIGGRTLAHNLRKIVQHDGSYLEVLAEAHRLGLLGPPEPTAEIAAAVIAADTAQPPPDDPPSSPEEPPDDPVGPDPDSPDGLAELLDDDADDDVDLDVDDFLDESELDE